MFFAYLTCPPNDSLCQWYAHIIDMCRTSVRFGALIYPTLWAMYVWRGIFWRV